MPDEEGNQTADVADTSLHAYGDGREEDAEPGSRGITGDQGSGDSASYHEGGHASEPEFGGAPAATGAQDAPGAHTGSGAGPADPDATLSDSDEDEGHEDPESPARAAAARPPRGNPPA